MPGNWSLDGNTPSAPYDAHVSAGVHLRIAVSAIAIVFSAIATDLVCPTGHSMSCTVRLLFFARGAGNRRVCPLAYTMQMRLGGVCAGPGLPASPRAARWLTSRGGDDQSSAAAR